MRFSYLSPLLFLFALPNLAGRAGRPAGSMDRTDQGISLASTLQQAREKTNKATKEKEGGRGQGQQGKGSLERWAGEVLTCETEGFGGGDCFVVNPTMSEVRRYVVGHVLTSNMLSPWSS